MAGAKGEFCIVKLWMQPGDWNALASWAVSEGFEIDAAIADVARAMAQARRDDVTLQTEDMAAWIGALPTGAALRELENRAARAEMGLREYVHAVLAGVAPVEAADHPGKVLVQREMLRDYAQGLAMVADS